jgi:hypothetical protein
MGGRRRLAQQAQASALGEEWVQELAAAAKASWAKLMDSNE